MGLLAGGGDMPLFLAFHFLAVLCRIELVALPPVEARKVVLEIYMFCSRNLSLFTLTSHRSSMYQSQRMFIESCLWDLV
jgi:hypothetical protein